MQTAIPVQDQVVSATSTCHVSKELERSSSNVSLVSKTVSFRSNVRDMLRTAWFIL